MSIPEISKGSMNSTERDLRSRLTQMVSGNGFMRGTLSVREKVCGKSTCKCAHGERHKALYLMASKNGGQQQLYVPKSQEAKVRKWIEQYEQVERLLEEISDLHWKKVRHRKE